MGARRKEGRTSARKGAAWPGLEALEKALGHRFKDRALLRRALTHRSFAHEEGTPGRDNEELEFLGDAVLSLVVSAMLCGKEAPGRVGDLSRARAWLVSEPSLAGKARALGLGAHLMLGRGEDRGGGREKDSLLADAYESVLGALYQDAGLEAAARLVRSQFADQVAGLVPGQRSDLDFKTDLQEALQGAGLPVPDYAVVSEAGPDHRKSFTVELSVAGKVLARGEGGTKKSAEQQAAHDMLQRLDTLLPELVSSRGIREA
ncbi:MAG TPA: ribonuclease III [Candidatus Polarisedimenticolia bacterium]|nr:ribonuclease III [Candidatus Polarisedimenticolia bacterium]